jgi:hypothetical protein
MQEKYCENLGTVSPEAVDLTSSQGVTRKTINPKEHYITQRVRGAYIVTVCQPEAVFDLSSATQVTNPTDKDIMKLNKRLSGQKDNPSRGLCFIPLKTNSSLKLVIFMDASFTNNADFSSQISFVIVLADKDNRAKILH